MLNLELSSFAKDLEGLKIAFESGADSVYIGGETFGMNTMSQKFSMEDLKTGIEYAHERNKKVYVTISLLPHNNDFVKLEEYLLKSEIRNFSIIDISFSLYIFPFILIF